MYGCIPIHCIGQSETENEVHLVRLNSNSEMLSMQVATSLLQSIRHYKLVEEQNILFGDKLGDYS